jgi:hypothetical protein
LGGIEMTEKIIVTTPNISEETLNEMKKFFMKTSIPRIIEARKSKKKGA